MASTLELLLLAQQAAFPPVVAFTDVSAITVTNQTSATAITKLYTVPPATPAAGTVYTLEAEFGGSWGAVAMTIWADISGTFTQLAIVSGTIGSSAQSVGGSMRLDVRVTSSTACKLGLSGEIQNISANADITFTNAAPLTSAGLSSATFAGGDTIGLAVSFASSVSGQHIVTGGSTFTMAGPGT